MATTKEIRRKLDERILKVSGYQNVIAGRLGYTSSQIETNTPGLVYVRVEGSGQVVTAINMIVPLIWDLPVLMARSKINPKLFEIVAPREAYGIPSAGGGALRNHHKQHEYPSADTVWVKGDQFLPFLILPKEEFIVSIFGGVMTLGNARRKVRNQELDLASEVPTDGAVYVLIQVESDGTIGTVTSTEVDGKELLTYADIPLPSAGAAELCAVRLYSSQQSLQRDNSVNDFVDLRFGTALSGSGSAHNHDSRYPRKYTGKTVPPTASDDSGDGYAVDDFWIDETHDRAYMALDVTVGAAVWQLLSSTTKLVMATGVTNPPVPVQNAEGDDWIYSAD